MTLLPCGIKGRLQRIKNSSDAAFIISSISIQ